MGYTNPIFNVRKVTGGYNIYPDGVTTDDLIILSNPTDTYPYIKLLGTSGIELRAATGLPIYFYDATTNYLNVTYNDTTGAKLSGARTDKDLWLSTVGTGLLRAPFVKTGHADQVIDGYVTLKDAAGTTIYLAALTPI